MVKRKAKIISIGVILIAIIAIGVILLIKTPPKIDDPIKIVDLKVSFISTINTKTEFSIINLNNTAMSVRIWGSHSHYGSGNDYEISANPRTVSIGAGQKYDFTGSNAFISGFSSVTWLPGKYSTIIEVRDLQTDKLITVAVIPNTFIV